MNRTAAPRVALRRVLALRWVVLVATLALALGAAACSDDDFEGAPEDRGAAAAQAAGVEPAEEHEQEEPAEQEVAEQEEAAEEGGEQAQEQAQAEPEPAEQEEEVIADLPGDPATGRELFIANGCQVCHGDNGEGGVGPTIAMTGLTLDEVISQYRNPRQLMPPFPADRVPDEDVAHIYSWLQTLPLPERIVPGEGTP